MHHHLQLRFFGKMTNFALLLQNVWFRLIVATTVAVAGLLALSSAMAILFIKPLELDLRDAKRGISRFERDLTRLKREVTAIEKKIDEKSIHSRKWIPVKKKRKAFHQAVCDALEKHCMDIENGAGK